MSFIVNCVFVLLMLWAIPETLTSSWPLGVIPEVLFLLICASNVRTIWKYGERGSKWDLRQVERPSAPSPGSRNPPRRHRLRES